LQLPSRTSNLLLLCIAAARGDDRWSLVATTKEEI
jgi:hypothetical protein